MPPEWIAAVERVGFPIAISLLFVSGFVALFLAARQVLTWIGTQLVLPIRDSILTTFAGFHKSVATMSDNLDAQTAAMQGMARDQAEMRAAIEDIKEHGCAIFRPKDAK